MKETIIVFAPHPDDETLACGGTIALNEKRGNQVYVVFMTDGRNSHSHTFGIMENPSPADMKRIRRKEAKAVMRKLGVDENNIFFLNYEDGTLGENIDTAVKKLKILIQKIKPASVYCPSLKDHHKDHKATNSIVEKAIQPLSIQIKMFQYIIWKSGVISRKQSHLLSTDISKVLTQKKLALEQYKSQTTIISPLQKRPVLVNRFINRFLIPTEEFITTF
jgi:LmbE family N-acetylglucosaminyl deacetylase